MRKVLFAGCLALVAALVAAGPAAAGNPTYADIKATAVCSLGNGGILHVDVGYVFTSSNQTLPNISIETVTLEKNIQDKNSPKWVGIANLYSGRPETSSTPYDVDVSLCPPTSRLSPDPQNLTFDLSGANALRAVVELTLDNANPKGKTGSTFLARCVSFSPPSCP